MTPFATRLGTACVVLGAGALAISAASRTEPQYPRIPNAANATTHRIEVPEGGAWSVQILADIQDGFRYVPQILREGEALGVDAIVMAGDLARGGGGHHLTLLRRQLERHPPRVPLFAVPGNHDTILASDRHHFVSSFGSAEFEFQIGHTRFIGLDSMSDRKSLCLERLERRLEEAEGRGEKVVLVRHHSPLGPAVAGESPQLAARLAALTLHQSMAFVFSGHAHHWDFQEREGVRFLIAPASGDRSHGQGQTAISYVILRWTGARFELEHHAFFRRNSTELVTAFEHVVHAHLLPAVSQLLPSSDRPVRPAQLAQQGR